LDQESDEPLLVLLQMQKEVAYVKLLTKTVGAKPPKKKLSME
jgi:hypothetical protein